MSAPASAKASEKPFRPWPVFWADRGQIARRAQCPSLPDGVG